MRLTPLLAASFSAVMVAGLGAAALPASARPATALARSGPTRHVDLQLNQAPSALVADAAMITGAATEAGVLGLHVDQSSATHLMISGPQSVVDHYFPLSGHGLGAIRSVPRVLSGIVSTAIDADDPTSVASPHLSIDPSQLATEYSATAPGGYVRVRPALTPQSPIVATLQLVGFDPAPLTAYAQQVAFANDPTYDPATMPAGAPQFTSVGIGRSPAYQPSRDSDDASSEFALDEETILGAAPEARLRAYVANNNSAGQLGAADAVLADVVAGMPIVALSTSWGTCEARINPKYLYALDDVYRRLTRAGVTVFAASGDDGTLDCRSDGGPDPAVDFPASSPSVVGVGGTQHMGTGPDTAWADARDGGGTGGGASRVFYRPSYQAASGSGPARMVPDIAVDADERTGFAFYQPDHHSPSGYDSPLPGHSAGGTSLATPLAAAMLTNVEVTHGFPGDATRGLGDIHRALYTANATSPGSVTDVLTADDPAAAYYIQPVRGGYDTATGLGVPVWSTLAAALYAPAPAQGSGPSFSVAKRTPEFAKFHFRAPVGTKAIGWYVDDARGDAGCEGNLYHAATLVRLPVGRTALAIHSIGPDLVCSRATHLVVYVGLDDRASKRTRGWTQKHNAAAYGGTYLESHQIGSAVSWSGFTGRVYDVLLDRQRHAGTAGIYLDGRLARIISVGSGRDRWAQLSTVTARSHGRHTITVKVLSGTVGVDGVQQHP